MSSRSAQPKRASAKFPKSSDKEKHKHLKPSKRTIKKELRKLRVQYEKTYKNEILGSLKEGIDENEVELEHLVFGGEDDILQRLEESPIPHHEDNENEDENIDDTESVDEPVAQKESRVPAWNDDDDDNILVSDRASSLTEPNILKRANEKYEVIAREKFLKITGTPAWADLDKKPESGGSDVESEEEELLQKTGNFVLKSESLPKDVIAVRKCRNLTEADSPIDMIKSVEFHPSSKVAVVAGFSGSATLYQIDGKNNPKIQSVHFQKFPIHTAHFTVDGNELVVGSKEFGYYYTYDMIRGKINKVPWEKAMEQSNVRRFCMSPDGRFIVIHGRCGKMHLITTKSKEWIESLKMNGEVVAIAFNKDGSRMYSHGTQGKVYVWDMNSRLCIHKFTDEGCITGTALAMSPNNQYLATGSDSGVVNVYDASSVMTSTQPKPLKAVMNLTTEVSHLKYNCTSELLAMSSSHKTDAIKLVHFPSKTVFSNFPIRERRLRYINSMDISPNSGYFLLGNNIGKVHLYRLKHYANY